MTTFRLGINTCFAVKRWPEPKAWARIVADDLGLDLVQHSLDLVDLTGLTGSNHHRASDAVRAACDDTGLDMHSTFTGLAAYSSNLLLDPDAEARRRAVRWYERAIDFTAAVGGRFTGGHVGAFSVTDFRHPVRRAWLDAELHALLNHLAACAWERGLAGLLVENLASEREPSTMEGIRALLSEGDEVHVPIRLCLDVGHQCVPHTGGADRDPYAWLQRLGRLAPVVQLQQSDALGDHHWPFTPAHNAEGRIEADRVLAAIDGSGAEDVALILEVIPPFEEDDDEVLDGLRQSCSYWRAAVTSFSRAA